MKKLFIVLLILFLIGILLIGSKFWIFSSENYLDSSLTGKAQSDNLQIDLDYVVKEFEPANEF